MFGSAISRWTMLHFEAALTCFVLAQLAMVAGVVFPMAPLLAPSTLAAVHLLTVGWLVVLMLGALHQFIPVITARGSVAGISALVSLLAILLGLAAMEAGFLALAGHLPPALLAALPGGGVLVLAGVGVALATLSRTLWQARPLPLSARFVAAGLVFLLAALAMGIVLGCAFAAPGLIGWARALTDGLRLHLLAGFIGWFTLTAVGVSYRLISMFTLAPEERGVPGETIFGLVVGGLAMAWLLGIAQAFGAPVPDVLVTAAMAFAGLGLALYVVDMARLYRARRRRRLELNTLMAVPALTALAASLLLALVLAVRGAGEAALGALGYLYLFGWLSGLGLGQLYKIVPFLTWLDRYGSLLGRQPVPRVQDLVDERRDRPWFILYFACVALAALAIALGRPTLWRVAALGHLAATLMILRALWLARHGAPRPSSAPASGLVFPARPPVAS